MQPTRASRGEQRRCASLDSMSVFNLLTDERFFELLEEHLPPHRERIYPPTQTLAMFVCQALSDDRSCRRVVNEHVAQCAAHGLTVPSCSTGSYCEARQRLPIELVDALRGEVARVTMRLGSSDGRAAPTLLIDGTGFSMPDTPQNQHEFPQSTTQAEGCGFPLGRLVAMVCADTGAITATRVMAAKGKGSTECSALREMIPELSAGTLIIGDALYEEYFNWSLLNRQGCQAIFEIHGSRALPAGLPRRFRVQRPRRPEWMSPQDYAQVPRSQEYRLVVSSRPNCRDRYLITTLLDQTQHPDEAVCERYRRRWDIETDFRSFKSDLGVGILSCRTPAMVRKELAVHVLGYNLIRLLMCEAALAAGAEPREISFRHAQQCWHAWVTLNAPLDESGWALLLKRIAQHRVRCRPGRREPRAVKRRPKRSTWLDQPRHIARTARQRYEKTGR